MRRWPHALNPEVARAALASGKAVLCEKPLGRDATEVRALLDAATATGVVHAVGFNHRFVPALRLARDLVRGGELGSCARSARDARAGRRRECALALAPTSTASKGSRSAEST